MTEDKKSRIHINKVYTRSGDAGKTRLTGGQVVDKDDLRIEAYGTVDELLVLIGGCANAVANLDIPKIEKENLITLLLRIQNELFNVGSSLSRMKEDEVTDSPKIKQQNIDQLESEIDRYNQVLPALTSFVLPGGNDANIWFHLARTVCRRAERICVKLSKSEEIYKFIIPYLNRLSDALFVWSRWVTIQTGKTEQLWEPT